MSRDLDSLSRKVGYAHKAIRHISPICSIGIYSIALGSAMMQENEIYKGSRMD